MNTIDISGLSKAKVLAALYNNSRPLGMGFLHHTPEPMSESEAQALLDGGENYFDYVKGRVMKVSLKGDVFSPALYDRDNGEGAAERVISILRQS